MDMSVQLLPRAIYLTFFSISFLRLGSSIVFAPDNSANQLKSSEKSLVAKMEEIFQRDWYSDLSRHF